jgi:hypothetical protein
VYCFNQPGRVSLGHRTGQQETNRPAPKETEVHHAKQGTTSMKTLIATTVIALSLFATAVSAQPYNGGYPQWAQKAFAGTGQ